MAMPHRNQPILVRQWALWASVCAVTLAGPARAADGGSPEGRVFDRAVASIDGKVITASQLDFEARVALVAAGGVQAAFAPLDQQLLEQSLELIINQRLATLEADQLDAYPLEPGELEQAIAAFRDRFGSEGRFSDFLEAHEADLNDLAQVLRRSLRARKALDGKLRLKAQVSEAEARSAQAERPELAHLPLETVRQKLFAERFAALVKAELKRARKSADVRLLGPFAPRPEQGR